MNDLFLIRLENGNAVLIQADSEAHAIQEAGLTEEAAASLGDKVEFYRTPEGRADLVTRLGSGPQHFTIKKVTDFYMALKLTDEGEFKLDEYGLEFLEQLYAEYPVLDSALGDERWTEVMGDDAHRPLRRILEDERRQAVETERTRLLASM